MFSPSRWIAPGEPWPGLPFLLAFSIFASDSPPQNIVSFLHIDPTEFAILNNGSFPAALPASGFVFTAVVPPSLGGLGISAMFQAVLIDTNTNNSAAAFSEGQEIRFTP